MDIYRQRQRRLREVRFAAQVVANRAAWATRVEIEDLAYPPCYRYLFDLPPERANRSRFVSDVT